MAETEKHTEGKSPACPVFPSLPEYSKMKLTAYERILITSQTERRHECRVKKLFKLYLAAGICLSLLAAGTAEANETYYLKGNTNYPLIQNGRNDVETDGTGLFLDLSSVKITDVFSDGLEASARLLQVGEKGKTSMIPVKVRFDVDGREWVQGTKNTWYGIPPQSVDPAALVVEYVRKEMGAESRRDALLGQIEKISAAKKGKLAKTDPKGAVLLTAAGGQKPPAKKEADKAKPAEKKPADTEDQKKIKDEPVQVTIVGVPEVEITSHNNGR